MQFVLFIYKVSHSVTCSKCIVFVFYVSKGGNNLRQIERLQIATGTSQALRKDHILVPSSNSSRYTVG